MLSSLFFGATAYILYTDEWTSKEKLANTMQETHSLTLLSAALGSNTY